MSVSTTITLPTVLFPVVVTSLLPPNLVPLIDCGILGAFGAVTFPPPPLLGAPLLPIAANPAPVAAIVAATPTAVDILFAVTNDAAAATDAPPDTIASDAPCATIATFAALFAIIIFAILIALSAINAAACSSSLPPANVFKAFTVSLAEFRYVVLIPNFVSFKYFSISICFFAASSAFFKSNSALKVFISAIFLSSSTFFNLCASTNSANEKS